MQAVRALSKRPTSIVASTLTKTVLVTNYFFRVRCEAALALVNVGIFCCGLVHLLISVLVCDPEDRLLGPVPSLQVVHAVLLRTGGPKPRIILTHLRPKSKRFLRHYRIFCQEELVESHFPRPI